MVWRSVRAGGETKTRQSRRTLALPVRCAEALTFHRAYQDQQREAAGGKWHDHGLVFASSVGTQRNANNVLRSFRAIVKRAGLNQGEWTPREMRHSFVSLLSDSGVPIENIARLVGHAWRVRCHRDGLPPADTPSAAGRRRGDGPYLRQAVQRCVALSLSPNLSPSRAIRLG